MLLKTNLYKCIFKLQHLFQNFPHFKQRKRPKLITILLVFFLEGGDCHSVNHAIGTKRENVKIEEREEGDIINQMLTGLHVVTAYLLDPALVMLLSSLIDGGFGKLCQCWVTDRLL